MGSENRANAKKLDVYAATWRLPIIVWQFLFFVGPLLFMIAMSFFLVKNYRMVEAFEMKNWVQMLGRDYFWDCYFLTFGLAALTTATASLVAFPASFALAFKASENLRRWAIFLLIIPFFTSYLVRISSWYVILAESGVINAILGWIGLGPYTMLNTKFGTIVGYLTLTLPSGGHPANSRPCQHQPRSCAGGQQFGLQSGAQHLQRHPAFGQDRAHRGGSVLLHPVIRRLR